MDIGLIMKQVSKIQDILKEYHIKECLIFGSRIKGSYKEYSDFDIAVEATNILKAVEQHKFLLSEGNTTENFTKLIVDEAGVKISYDLNMDISIDVNFNDEYFYKKSVFQPHVRIIKNGRRVRKDTIERHILTARKTITTSSIEKAYWGDREQLFYLKQLIYRYVGCARFYSYIHSKEIFLNPTSIELKSMRNTIIHDICLLSSIIDKVDEKIILNENLPYSLLSTLSDIKKEKQTNKQNFNTMALGWQVCCIEDLSDNEVNKFWDFHFETKNTILSFLEAAKESGPDGLHYQAYRLYNYSFKDPDGFLNHIKDEYFVKNAIEDNDLFLSVLDQIM